MGNPGSGADLGLLAVRYSCYKFGYFVAATAGARTRVFRPFLIVKWYVGQPTGGGLWSMYPDESSAGR